MNSVQKWSVTLIATLVVFLSFNMSALAKEWTFQVTENVNKSWKITFSKPLEAASVNSQNVYVSNGEKHHPVTVRLSANGKTIEVTPTAAYEVGKPYRLVISKSVKSEDGKSLRSPVEAPFQVVNPDDDIQAINSLSGSAFSNITVITSPNVYRVTIAGEDMHYRGNNVYTYALLDVKPGTTVSIVSYDENNKRLESKNYIIN